MSGTEPSPTEASGPRETEEGEDQLARENRELRAELQRLRRVRSELEETENRFERFARTVSDVVCRFDPRTRQYVFISPSFQNQTGYSVAELLANPAEISNKLTHPEDLERVTRLVAEHRDAPRDAGPLNMEYRLVRKDGSVIWVCETLNRDFSENGELVGVNSVIRDITARKRIEDRFEKFARNVSDVIYRYDNRRDRFDFISPSFLELTGFEPEELAEDPMLIIRRIHPDDRDRVMSIAKEHMRRGREAGPVTLEYRVYRKDGELIWVTETIDYVFSDEGELLSTNSVVRDTTLWRRTQEERERLIAELRAKNTELERFTYSVSHDLKSPLITIRGFLGLLEEDLAAGNDEEVRRDVERVNHAVDLMAELLDGLLELSRIGRVLRPLEDVDLAELAREAEALNAGRIRDRGIQVEIDPDLPTVKGDSRRLLQVYQNLIDNACKFMGSQSEPRIQIGVRPGSPPVLFVRDNGMGIDPGDQTRIFAVFHQLERDLGGSGIGLALVKRIVEVHGGRIWVESKGEGSGATFLFTLSS